MGGCAHTVAGGEEAADGGHLVVAPEVLRGCQVLGTADPGPGLAGVGTHDVGFGQHDLGRSLLRCNVLGGPGEGLRYGHIQEVFPCLVANLVHLDRVALGQLLHRLLGAHVHGAKTVPKVEVHLVVAKRCGSRDGRAVWLVLIQLCGSGNGVVLAQGVGDPGVEILEPHAHGTVAVLEPCGYEAVLHLSHFYARRDHQPVGRAGGEHRVPGPAQPLVHGAGAEHVGRAAGGHDYGLGSEYVEFVVAHGESYSPLLSFQSRWNQSAGGSPRPARTGCPGQGRCGPVPRRWV